MSINILSVFIFLLFCISCNPSIAKKDKIAIKKTDIKKIEQSANVYYQNNDYKKAKLSYDSLLSIDSSNGEYYFRRAVSKRQLDDSLGAIDDYYKALNFNYYKKVSIYLNLGNLYRTSHRYDSALHFYNECLKLDPNNEDAILRKDFVLEVLRKFK